MGLTIFTVLAAIIVTVAAAGVRGKTAPIRQFRLAAAASVVYAVALGSGYWMAAFPGTGAALAVVAIRIAATGAAVAYLAFLRLGMGYPDAGAGKALDAVFAVVMVGMAVPIIGTDLYLVSVTRTGSDFFRVDGALHGVLGSTGAAFGLVAALVMAVRSRTVRNRVHRQHLVVMATGLVGSTVWGYLFAVLGPSSGLGLMYPMSAANVIPSVLTGAWALTSTRPFQTGAMVRSILGYTVVAVLAGVPTGVIMGLVYLLRDSSPLITIIAGALLFLPMARLADTIVRNRPGSSRDEASREELATGIAHLDLSAGRETVLKGLEALMSSALDCSWVVVLTEDDDGNLVRILPDDGSLVTPAGSPVAEAISAVDRRVLFRSDLQSDPALSRQSAALSVFFDALGAEAVVLASEGRRVVGVFAFGPRRSGAEYDQLDYAMLEAVHGKLFVIAYYVKHVGRESLLATVEQELGLADQIISAVQERVDAINHPSASLAYRCVAPRGLGGDMFDTVRLSEHRWFFVVGDVAGKGLNASMSMVILKSMIRTLLGSEKDFTALVAGINTFIKDRLPRGTFFSGVFGFLALDRGTLHFINCGIPAMFYRTPGLDTAIETQGEGRMLGFVRNVTPYLKTRKLVLTPGSRLVMATDGILDAESIRGERYGKERLSRILAENTGSTAAATIDAMTASVESFAGGRIDDDYTVLVLDYKGSTGERQR